MLLDSDIRIGSVAKAAHEEEMKELEVMEQTILVVLQRVMTQLL